MRDAEPPEWADVRGSQRRLADPDSVPEDAVEQFEIALLTGLRNLGGAS